MKKINNHILKNAEYISSPHQEGRPESEQLSLIVLHSISLPEGEYGTDYVRQLFLGILDCQAHESFASLQGVRVSSHLFIRRDGSIIQFVPFNKIAWHAGVSSYKGKSNCNSFSIGIELEGSKKDSYTEEQYDVLVDTYKDIVNEYDSLEAEAIVGHKDIAAGRKDDPWNFNWEKYWEKFYSILN